ncbi:MAG: hypothetical protein ACJ8FY_26130 [Gemmataceae bacterium]
MAHLTTADRVFRRIALVVGALLFGAVIVQVLRVGMNSASGQEKKPGVGEGKTEVELIRQTARDVERKSHGCVVCHANTENVHSKPTVKLGCVDCHGGNPDAETLEGGHVHPRFPEVWVTSANPVRSYAVLNHESPEFIRFVNPGDLRINHLSCGTAGCHQDIVKDVRTSMMTHGAMLWEAALYNNGGYPSKHAQFGESYSTTGAPQRLLTLPPPTEDDFKRHGVLPYLNPLPKFEITQPGNILRIFERGGLPKPDTGVPDRMAEPGRPFLERLSDRGLGTENRTDPVFLGLQKTRLLDPTLNFLGTNDHAGDYRSSGCTSCHVVYANDRSAVHSGPWATYGNRGLSFNPDPTIPKDEPGHPIKHKFAWAPPTSQCMVCHIHPGTTVMNSYIGYMWWDNETDGEQMYPAKQKYPTAEEFTQSQMSNPDETAARGLWSDPKFLESLYTDVNPNLKHTQFGDFHGHGWVFRAVFAKDRKGVLRNHKGEPIEQVTAESMKRAVDLPAAIKQLGREGMTKKQIEEKKETLDAERDHLPLHLLDIHMEKGMHCVDCHFNISTHGNGKLYGEVRNAVEIACIDCHGTTTRRASLKSSGNASPHGGLNFEVLRTPFGKRRFEREGDKVFQNSMVEKGLRWECVQVMDVITQGNEHYNEKARLAKTVRFQGDQFVWGDVPKAGDGQPDESKCAHNNKNMSCIACHSSWNPTCYGCHLPQKANKKMPELHNNGDISRNYISYNFQTLRDDVFMLAKDGDVTGNKIGPARSSCAIHVGSYNGNRESIYVQQQTISADGLSGIAFSTNVPHTVRGKGQYETKQCTDCHVSAKDDNNAIMAQVLMQGTNSLNFMGRYCWVAGGEHGLYSVEVSERDEPQTVFGSSLHRLAYPDNFHKFVEEGRQLKIAYEHPGKDIGDNVIYPHRKVEVQSVQNRGEYCYAACGEGGLKVFDISFIDHKGFSERIFTAPVSPLGQKFYVNTKYATAVAAPATTAPDPTRKLHPDNEEQAVHGLYAHVYVTDKYEGLILVGAGTLLDGNPLNNFLKRELTFNPDGLLAGAKAITIAGVYAYISCDAGVVVINLDKPLEPKIAAVLKEGELIHHANAVQIQFRYAYVCDDEGIKVFDVTNLADPKPVSKLAVAGVHNIYLARTYAYCAAGKHGLVILDIENPEKPKVDQVYNANGCINDMHDVKLAITYVSQFAYLADGKNGLRIVQLTSPETPGNDGFSPRPTPELIATYKLPEGGHALAIAKALDRDRAVDESGNQLSVFGRVGARPMNKEEQERMYLRNGKVWKASDEPKDYGKARPYRPVK